MCAVLDDPVVARYVTVDELLGKRSRHRAGLLGLASDQGLLRLRPLGA